MRAIVFLCNRIKKFLHLNPLFTLDKSLVLTNRNNPLANRLAFNTSVLPLFQRQSNQSIRLICHKQRDIQHISVQFQIVQ